MVSESLVRKIAWLIHDNYGKMPLNKQAKEVLQAILSDPSIVEIEVGAELPKPPIPCPEEIPYDIYYYRGYYQALRDMANWVKKKDE
ncbi:hypothetical protein LCGC14_1649610 [marine sediment metagenome]|uniref:Uncharacterized protein n=1 Tax=marine sediment metagenome TaxID=412755 RepID=A0A0F9IJS9_9ZZZZ